MASNINPNNIDGSFPVAGQDNSSQGFRDNFTNIRQNFQFAENEINDLQSKVILKAALIGGTLNNNMNNNVLEAAAIKDFSAPRVTVTPEAGTATVNYSAGHYQTINTAGDITLAFGTDWPDTGNYGLVKVQININKNLITDIPFTVTLPSGPTFLNTAGLQGYNAGTRTISFGTTGFYEFAFGSYDGGSTISIFDLSRALVDFSTADLSVDDLTATGNVVATGNVSGGNVTSSGTITADATITGGNVTTGGLMSATGSITGGSLITGGSASVSTLSATGNVIGVLRPKNNASGTETAVPLVFSAGTNVDIPTATLPGGSFEYDGTSLYAAPTQNQRGLIPTTMYRVATVGRTLSDNTSAQDVFDSPATITLVGSTTYEFESVYYITRAAGGVSRTWSVLFDVGGSLTSITYMAETSSTASNILGPVSRIRGAAATATVVTAASTATNENVTIHLRGIIRTNAGGTFKPQVQCSAIAGGAATILTNSYIRFTPLGASVGQIGLWS